MADKQDKADLESIEGRLHEQDETIDVSSSKQRRDSAVADIPSSAEAVVTPPKALITALAGREGAACDQAFVVVWPKGEWKGMPVTGYCAEPLCITTGQCTGTRFVPHIDQWTTTDPELRSRRKLTRNEIVAAVRAMARRAAQQTGRDEERTDKEILAHVKMVWIKTIEAIKGQGGKWVN